MSTPIRPVAPPVCPATRRGYRNPGLLAGTLFGLLASNLALAGNIGCLSPLSGDNQTVVQGTRLFVPVVAFGVSTPTPASIGTGEPINWASNSPTVFFSNGQTTSNSTAPWVFDGFEYRIETVEQVYVGVGTPPGQVIVSAGNVVCTGRANFVVNVAPLIAPTAVSKTDTSFPIPAGNSINLALTATHQDGNGTVLSAVNVPFIFTINSGPGSLDSSTALSTKKVYTDGIGQSYTDLFINSNANDGQTVVVNASAPGYPPVTFVVTVGTPPPTVSVTVVSGDGQQMAPETQGEPITIRLDNGNFVHIGSVDIDVVEGDAIIAESGSTSFTSNDFNEDGRHVFSLISGTTPGPVSVRIQSAAVIPAFVSAEVISVEPLLPLEIVSGDGQTAQVGSTLPELLTVRVPAVPQSAGTRAPGKALEAMRFRVTRGAAVFPDNNLTSIDVAVDPLTGEAQAELRYGFEIGGVDVTASLDGYAPVTFHLQATAPGAARALTQATVPSLGTTGFDSSPLAVLLTEAGAPVVGAGIQWNVVSGDAVLNQTNSTTAADGRAQTTVRFGNTAGNVLVRALHAVGGGELAVDFNLSSADPTLSVVNGDNQSGPIGTTTDAPIVFQLRDAAGSAIAGELLTFAVFGDATALASSATTDSSGRAGVSIRFGSTPSEIKIDATALSGRLLAVAGASSFTPNLTILSGDNQSGRVGTALPQPLAVKIGAAMQAPLAKGLSGLTVLWQVTCGNGTLASSSTLTDANGESTNQLVLGGEPGCNNVEASIAGIGRVTFHATGTLPENSVLEIVSGDGQALVPLEDSAPLKIRLLTASGTPVAGVVVRFVADRSGATLTPSEATTASDGTAATIARLGLPAGFTITASVHDAPSITPVAFHLNAGVINTANIGTAEAGVAEAIDKGCPVLAGLANPTPAQADLLARCSEIVVNANDDPGDVNRALGEMLADEATSQNTAALAAANNQFDNIKSRFAALRAGSRGLDVNGLSILGPGGALPMSLLPSAIALAAGEPPEEVGSEFSRWGFFATGTIGRGDRDPDTLDPGFSYDSYGITAGVDYRATESWILGAALGFNRNNTELRQNQGGMDSKGWTMSGYASFFKGSSWYADGVLTYGRNSYDIDRRINYSIDSLIGGTTIIDQIASAAPDGDQQAAAISFGRDFNKGAWTFGPYLRAAYTKLDFDAYSESMSNPTGAGSGLALAVDGRTLKSLQGVVGGKLSYAMSTSWGILLPSAQIEWVNEFEDDPEQLVTRFVHDPTQTDIFIDSERADQRFFNLGLGLSGVFASGRSAYVYFEHVAGQERMSSNSLAIGVRIEF